MSKNHEKDTNINVVDENNIDKLDITKENVENILLFSYLVSFFCFIGIGFILDLLNQYSIIHFQIWGDMSMTDLMVILFIFTCTSKFLLKDQE